MFSCFSPSSVEFVCLFVALSHHRSGSGLCFSHPNPPAAVQSPNQRSSTSPTPFHQHQNGSMTYPCGLPGNEAGINPQRLIGTSPLAPLQVLQLFYWSQLGVGTQPPLGGMIQSPKRESEKSCSYKSKELLRWVFVWQIHSLKSPHALVIIHQG